MTALSEYAKLEAEAVFHDAASGDAINVVLSFGERSLIIMSLDDRALAHWPLATLFSRTGAKGETAEIAPDRNAEDYISLTDAEMIAAIQAVCPNLYETPPTPPVPRRTKLRWAVAIFLGIMVAALISAPYAIKKIIDDTSLVQERRLGFAMHPFVVEELRGGKPEVWQCTAPEGDTALTLLTKRLVAEENRSLNVSVVDLPTAGTLVLPGGNVVIFRGILDRANSPEALGGLLAHQFAHDARRTPLKHVIAHFDVVDLVKYWWGAQPEEELIENATAAFLAHPYSHDVEQATDAIAFTAMAAAGLPTQPYASDLATWNGPANHPLSFAVRHPSPKRAETAKASDTIGNAPFRPALDDRSWLALANICDERTPFD